MDKIHKKTFKIIYCLSKKIKFIFYVKYIEFDKIGYYDLRYIHIFFYSNYLASDSLPYTCTYKLRGNLKKYAH